MDNLADLAKALQALRHDTGLSQVEFAQRASIPRATLSRMENASLGDMSVSALMRFLAAAGHELQFVRRAGHSRTLEDILAEQRQPSGTDR
jgi:transcriptional regulator with XRE-family HTH domain